MSTDFCLKSRLMNDRYQKRGSGLVVSQFLKHKINSDFFVDLDLIRLVMNIVFFVLTLEVLKT